MSGNSAQQTAHIVTERSVAGWDDDDDDGRSTTKPFKKRYEIAIPTRNLRWANLARYLELEFKELGVQIPKDQKVSSARLWMMRLPAPPMTACRVHTQRGGWLRAQLSR